MAFFEIDQASRCGRDLVAASRLAHQLKTNVDLQVQRVTNMANDAEVQENFGTTLTRQQLLDTLSAAKTQLDHASVAAIIGQLG